MPSETSTQAQLASLIQKLQTERQEHQDAIAQIDATFEQFGIMASAKKRLGRPRKTVITAGPALPEAAAAPAKKGTRKARRHFPVTGNESILAFVKSAGKKGKMTSEIVKYWKAEGRSGDGYTALGELVTAKKLKREKIEGAKGSRYTVA